MNRHSKKLLHSHLCFNVFSSLLWLHSKCNRIIFPIINKYCSQYLLIVGLKPLRFVYFSVSLFGSCVLFNGSFLIFNARRERKKETIFFSRKYSRIVTCACVLMLGYSGKHSRFFTLDGFNGKISQKIKY